MKFPLLEFDGQWNLHFKDIATVERDWFLQTLRERGVLGNHHRSIHDFFGTLRKRVFTELLIDITNPDIVSSILIIVSVAGRPGNSQFCQKINSSVGGIRFPKFTLTH